MNKTLTKSRKAFVILLDVGLNAAEKFCTKTFENDLLASIEFLDWTLSRNIFTDSNDEFSLILFGHNETRNELLSDISNIYVYNDEYETAKIDWLKFLRKEIEINDKISGDYLSALFVGLESIKIYSENTNPKTLISKTIILISNLAGLDIKEELMEVTTAISFGFKKLAANLIVIGPNLKLKPQSASQKIGFEFITCLLDKVNGSSFSLSEKLLELSFYVPKLIQPRGQLFNFQIAKNFSIPIQMFVKNSDTSIKHSFQCISTSTTSNTALRKIRQYETLKDRNQIDNNFFNLNNINDDNVSDNQTKTPLLKIVNKSNIIKGYRYGQNLIPISVTKESILNYLKEEKQLQLIYFTKFENILPQYIMSNCRYLLPDLNNEGAFKSFLALVNIMIELEVVALCRYVFNVNSNPRIACLVPKKSKKNIPILIHYILPFSEDLRTCNFLSLKQFDVEPKDDQLNLINEYITNMMLSDSFGNNEEFRCKDILNPKNQYQCQYLRQKALEPHKINPEIKWDEFLKFVSPSENLLKKTTSNIAMIKKCFAIDSNFIPR